MVTKFERDIGMTWKEQTVGTSLYEGHLHTRRRVPRMRRVWIAVAINVGSES